MTFKDLWTAIKKTWQSRPFAIILPLAALGWYFCEHGHRFVLATVANGGSLPAWQDFAAGAALLATKFERLTEFFVGPPAPATLPEPVGPGTPGNGPKIVAMLAVFLGLALGAGGCAHVDAIVRDVDSCASEQGGKVIYDLEQGSVKAIIDALECANSGGQSGLAVCVEADLVPIAAGLGADGERFVACVVTKVENDPNALAKQRANARAARLTLFRSPGWSKLPAASR